MLCDSTQDLVCRGDHVTTRQAELGDSEEEFVSYGSRETGPSWTGPVGGAHQAGQEQRRVGSETCAVASAGRTERTRAGTVSLADSVASGLQGV